tara:strand:- start:4669 stop:9732 length:5064 start_codon:yes stop_codon:yes gene_type:complete
MALKDLITDLSKFKYTDYDNAGINNSKIGGRHGGTTGPTPAQPPHDETHSKFDDGVGRGVYPNDEPQQFTVNGYQVTGKKRFYIGWQGDLIPHDESLHGIGPFNKIAGVFDHTQTRDRLRKVYDNYDSIEFGADGSVHVGNQDLAGVVGGGLSYYGNLKPITPRGSIFSDSDGNYRVPQEGKNTNPPGGISNIPLFEGTKPESGFDRSLMYIPNHTEPLIPEFKQFTRSDSALKRYNKDTLLEIGQFDGIKGVDDRVFEWPATRPYNLVFKGVTPWAPMWTMDPVSGASSNIDVTLNSTQPYIVRQVGDRWGLYEGDPEDGGEHLSGAIEWANALSGEFLRAPLDVMIDRSVADIGRIAKFLTSTKGTLFLGKQAILQAFSPTIETKLYNPLSLGSIVPMIHVNRHFGGKRYVDVVPSDKAIEAVGDLMPDVSVGPITIGANDIINGAFNAAGIEQPSFGRVEMQSPLAEIGGQKLPLDKRVALSNPNRFMWPGPMGIFVTTGTDAAIAEASKIESSQTRVLKRAKEQSGGGVPDLFQKHSFNKYSRDNVYLDGKGILFVPESASPFGTLGSFPISVTQATSMATDALLNWGNSLIGGENTKKSDYTPPTRGIDLESPLQKVIGENVFSATDVVVNRDKEAFGGDLWGPERPDGIYEQFALKEIGARKSVQIGVISNSVITVKTHSNKHDKTSVALGGVDILNIDETISALQKDGQWTRMNWGFLSDENKEVGAGGVEPIAPGGSYGVHFNTIYPYDTIRLGLVAENGMTIGASRRKTAKGYEEVSDFDDGVPGALQHKLYYHAFAKPVVPVEKGDVRPTDNIPAVTHTLAHLDKDYSTKYGGKIVGAGIQGISYFDGDLFGPYRGKDGVERYDKIVRTDGSKIIQLGAASPVSVKKNYIHIGSDSGTQTPLTTKKIEYKPIDENYTPQSSTENKLRDTNIYIGDQFGDYTQETTLQKYFPNTTTLVPEGEYKNIGWTLNKTATDYFKKDTLSAKSKIVVTHKHSKMGDKQYAIDLTKNRIVKTDATAGAYSGDVYGDSKKYGNLIGNIEKSQDDTPHLYKNTKLKINDKGEPELTFNLAYNTNITRTNTYKSLISKGDTGPIIDKKVNLRELKDYPWSTQFLIGANKARGVRSVGNIYGPTGKGRYGFVEYSANKAYAKDVVISQHGSSIRQDQTTGDWYFTDMKSTSFNTPGSVYKVALEFHKDNSYSIKELPGGLDFQGRTTKIIPIRTDPTKGGPGGGQLIATEAVSRGAGESNLDVVTVSDPKSPTGVSDIPIAHKNTSSDNTTSNVDTDPDTQKTNKPTTTTVPAEASLHLHTTNEQSKNADTPPTPEGAAPGPINKYKAHKYGDIGKDNLRYGKAFFSPGELRIDVNPDDLTDPDKKAKGVLPNYEGLVKKRQELSNVVYQLGNPGTPKVLSVSDTGDDPIGGPIKPGGVDGDNKPTNYIGVGTDRVNMIPYHDEESAYPDGTSDFIKFKIRDVINKKWLIFRATLSSISENFAPEWSSERYIGRPDNVHVYQGVERTMSFSFMIYPHTKQELPILWEKLNYLVGLTYPTWRSANSTGGKRMEAPFVQITIGDMYNEVPGFFGGIGVEIDDNGTWELDKHLQLPKAITVNCDFTHIGKHPLASQGKHYDLNWLKEYNQKEAKLGDRPDEWIPFYEKIGQVGLNSNTQNPQAVVSAAESGG